MNRPNLSVITGARATRITFDGKRATGIAYRKGKQDLEVRARREVIVCGGAFNSPHLLQLSGIGDGAMLKTHGVEVRHHLPGVGRNLQDHLDFIFIYKSRSNDMFGIGIRPTVKAISEAWRWRKDGRSMMASTFAESGAFIKSDPGLARPDLQLHFVVAMVDDHARRLHLGSGYSCHVCVLRPHSRGTVDLASANPMDDPRIDPQFLSDERDAALMLKGVKLTREIMNAQPLADWRKSELYMRGDESDEELMAHIRGRADTIYHPVGTCRMGKDGEAVVDTRLKVHGIESLRVVDASVMPTLIGGNTNAPTVMIAERAAEFVRDGI